MIEVERPAAAHSTSRAKWIWNWFATCLCAIVNWQNFLCKGTFTLLSYSKWLSLKVIVLIILVCRDLTLRFWWCRRLWEIQYLLYRWCLLIILLYGSTNYYRLLISVFSLRVEKVSQILKRRISEGHLNWHLWIFRLWFLDCFVNNLDAISSMFKCWIVLTGCLLSVKLFVILGVCRNAIRLTIPSDLFIHHNRLTLSYSLLLIFIHL